MDPGGGYRQGPDIDQLGDLSMHNHVTAKPLSWTSDLVTRMPYGELAVALYASDMPTPTGSRSARQDPQQIAAWVEQGTARLGGELAVWKRDREEREFNGRTANKSRSQLSKQEKAQERLLWPDRRREEYARSCAFWLRAAIEDAGVEWPHSMRLVEIGSWDGVTIMQWVCTRDIEMGKRSATVAA
jgi:hypothetical protein